MPKTVPVLFEKDVPCKLRDGVTLFANIYRPHVEGSYPVLLSRLPYNKNLADFSHRYIDPFRVAAAGYVVVIQDVRGRFASEGDFEPFIQEAADGYDAVEWAARLPYSNGNVGMFGMSYYGFTQLYAAIEKPPSLKAIFPAMTGNDLREGFLYRGGALELGLVETWMLDSIAPNYMERTQAADYAEIRKAIASDLEQLDYWYDYKPIKAWPPLMKHGPMGELFQRWVTAKLNSEQLGNAGYREKLHKLNLPAYHLAGWYDCFLGPTLSNYQEMAQSKNSHQKLIIGPWEHGVFSPRVGERFFGSHAAGDWLDEKDNLTSLHLQWFNQWLKESEPVAEVDEPPVKIFVMGINEWRSEQEWPLQRTVYTPFYLQENGRLDRTPPGDQPADTFVYDPQSPVPTKGGGVLFYQGKHAGPIDQTAGEEREDILVYTSRILEGPLEVTGPVKVVLWAATDAPDTDFTAKLIDVAPDGKAYNLTDGIIRAKYRDGYTEQKPLTGEIIRYEIDLWATSNVFLPGHAIRIEIASSNFPRYDPNPNTGQTLLDTTATVKATQTIYHQTDYPSYVLLPMIPLEDDQEETEQVEHK